MKDAKVGELWRREIHGRYKCGDIVALILKLVEERAKKYVDEIQVPFSGPYDYEGTWKTSCRMACRDFDIPYNEYRNYIGI